MTDVNKMINGTISAAQRYKIKWKQSLKPV